MTAQGFRGFNDRGTMEFDDRLTLIYGPNSCGKTSISEALEWLLYGTTSKVDAADSKEEYRGSLRNRHFPSGATAFVEAIFVVEDGQEITFRGNLSGDESIQRLVDGLETESWPLDCDLSKAPRPFILQHALKTLLLAKPIDRYQGFAGLLGLGELQTFRKNVVSLCTKADACAPAAVERVREQVAALNARCASVPGLDSIAEALGRGTEGLADAYEAIKIESARRIPVGTEPDSVVPQLHRSREEAVGKVFEGSVALGDYSQGETDTNSTDEAFFSSFTEESFVESYCELVQLGTLQHLRERAQFFELGVKLLSDKPTQCPFCGKEIDRQVTDHILDEHGQLVREGDTCKSLEKQRDKVEGQVETLRQRLDAYHERNAEKARALLAVESTLHKVKSILVPKHQTHFDSIQNTVRELSAASKALERLVGGVREALAEVESSVSESSEDAALLKTLGERLLEYVAEAPSYRSSISARAAAMSDAQEILNHELDVLAGTEDIGILVDLIEQRDSVEKALRVEDILVGLKELRTAVDQFVAGEVLDRISGELSGEVMEWYGRIRTDGDPDVHFSGFDVPLTKRSTLKAGRIDVKATSYGKDLVSAVSSLSESKLNALGLCLCIATNTMSESPFDFLVVDDPIQSWDVQHETQFIEVVKSLVGQGKQVILMSHNRQWLDQVCLGCRALNGRYYEITGYTQEGPLIDELSWARWKDRLREVDAILKDQTAGTVKLQHAEEDIRIVVAQLTSELHFKTSGTRKSPHNLNHAKVRKMLLECGVDSGLVDKVCQTFGTTDDAHHAPKDYVPDRQRIQRYHSYCWELAQLLKDA